MAWQGANIMVTVYTALRGVLSIYMQTILRNSYYRFRSMFESILFSNALGFRSPTILVVMSFLYIPRFPDTIVMGIILLCTHQSRKVFVFRYLPSPTVQCHSHRSNSRTFISHFDHSPDSPGSIPLTHSTLSNHNSRHADPGPQTSPRLHIKPHKLNHTIYMTQRPGS